MSFVLYMLAAARRDLGRCDAGTTISAIAYVAGVKSRIASLPMCPSCASICLP